MTINQNREAEKLTVALGGRLDTTTAHQLEKVLLEIPSEINELVIDMTELEYVSSAGLRVILKAQKMMLGKGGLKLTNINESIMEVFEITGFADILNIE